MNRGDAGKCGFHGVELLLRDDEDRADLGGRGSVVHELIAIGVGGGGGAPVTGEEVGRVDTVGTLGDLGGVEGVEHPELSVWGFWGCGETKTYSFASWT